jgi:isoleucyl-tRNA synthetase
LQAETVFEAGWPNVDDKWHSFSERLTFWTTLLQVRGEVNRVIEQARAGKLVGASLDGKVYLYVSAPDLQQSLTSLSGSNEGVDALHRIFLTSQVSTHSFP